MAVERSARIDPLYRPDDAMTITVYAGDLNVTVGGAEISAPGEIRMRLWPRRNLFANLRTTAPGLSLLLPPSHEPQVSVPVGQDLTPPPGPSPTAPVDRWTTKGLYVPDLDAGDVGAVSRFVIHISQSVQDPGMTPRTEMSDGSTQRVIRFALPG